MIILSLIVRVLLRIESPHLIFRRSTLLYRWRFYLLHLSQFVLGLKVLIFVWWVTVAHNLIRWSLINFLLTSCFLMSMSKFNVGVVELMSVLCWSALNNIFLMLWAMFERRIQRCCVGDIGSVVFILVSHGDSLINCPWVIHTDIRVLCHLRVIFYGWLTGSGLDLVLISSQVEKALTTLNTESFSVCTGEVFYWASYG